MQIALRSLSNNGPKRLLRSSLPGATRRSENARRPTAELQQNRPSGDAFEQRGGRLRQSASDVPTASGRKHCVCVLSTRIRLAGRRFPSCVRLRRTQLNQAETLSTLKTNIGRHSIGRRCFAIFSVFVGRPWSTILELFCSVRLRVCKVVGWTC